MKRPAFMFYPSDWRRDNELRVCSIGARGLWIEMMAIMHDGTPYGHLAVAGCPVTTAQLASLVGVTTTVCSRLLAELETHHVFSRTDARVIYSRRMVKDERLREVRAASGKLGGNPRLKVTSMDNQPDKQASKQNQTPSVAVVVASSVSDAKLPTTKEFRAPQKRRSASGPTETWLTPLAEAHEQVYGAGTFRALAGEFARFWRPLIEAHGPQKCAEVWRFSQDCTDRERPFRTPKYVASHFADFDPKGPGFPEAA